MVVGVGRLAVQVVAEAEILLLSAVTEQIILEEEEVEVVIH